MAAGNKSLGRFDLTDIPPAPRGVPQVEVTFDIDANGILHVSARDKATGKENRIVIKSSSGLSEAEIQRMVQDAEAHAEEDRRAHELVDARNQAEALVHSTRKSLHDLGDKVSAADKGAIEAAMRDLEAAVKGDDKAEITAKTEALSQASHKLTEQMYAQSQANASPGGDAQQPGGTHAGGDNVVDAEFEEVNENRREK